MVLGYDAKTTDANLIENTDEYYTFDRCDKYCFPEGYSPEKNMISVQSDDSKSELSTDSKESINPSLVGKEQEESSSMLTSDGPMDSPWPMKCHDTYHTGRSPYSTANNPGIEKWRYQTGDAITSDPAIGNDGTIYIGSMDTYFYAMNPNGTLKWRFKTGDCIKGPPSIADDGTVYIGSFDDYLYALYPNGTLKWKCDIWYGTDTNPSIAIDGTIYVCSSSKLFAIYPNGTKKWTYDFPSERHIGKSSQAISADGTIYVGTNKGEGAGGDIIAVNPDGTERWRKVIAEHWVDSSPCIGEDGTVYIGSTYDQGKGYLHAFGKVESNVPPETPTISGETNGKVGESYWYSITAVDSDRNPISFYIDWGDGDEGWQSERASGEKCYYEHSWLTIGSYTIRVKAKDVMGEESDWATLSVSMPKNKPYINTPFLYFLDNHPHLFPLLRHLMGL